MILTRPSYDWALGKRGTEQSYTALGELINRGWAVNGVAALWLFITSCSLHVQPAPESVLPTASRSAASMRIYQLPQGEVAAPISITAAGVPLPVSLCYVSACPFNRRWPGHQRTTDQREVAYFARLAAEWPITFRYTPAHPFSVCTVRPLSAKVTPKVENGTITFTLPCAGGYTVELDGLHNALHLFLDPPLNYSVRSEERRVCEE